MTQSSFHFQTYLLNKWFERFLDRMSENLNSFRVHFSFAVFNLVLITHRPLASHID